MCKLRTYLTKLFVAVQVFSLCVLILIDCDRVTGTKESIRSVDVEKTKVWGPGLEPDKIILPVRYFYIQAIDGYGNR